MVQIKKIGAGEWALVRDVRLAALQDAPINFWATYEDEVQRPDGWWRDRFIGEGAWFVALDGPDPVGIAAAVGDHDLGRAMKQLISMWVAPAARRRGVGRALVEAVVAWAREEGLSALQLEVTETNDAAARLYESCGFAFTGRTQPHPREADLMEREMRLKL